MCKIFVFFDLLIIVHILILASYEKYTMLDFDS